MAVSAGADVGVDGAGVDAVGMDAALGGALVVQAARRRAAAIKRLRDRFMLYLCSNYELDEQSKQSSKEQVALLSITIMLPAHV